jgi:hypothetical protein
MVHVEGKAGASYKPKVRMEGRVGTEGRGLRWNEGGGVEVGSGYLSL